MSTPAPFTPSGPWLHLMDRIADAVSDPGGRPPRSDAEKAAAVWAVVGPELEAAPDGDMLNAEAAADAVLAVRDDELARLRAERDQISDRVEWWEAAHARMRDRAEVAVVRMERGEAAVQRARGVADWIGRHHPGLDHDHRIITALDAAGQPDTTEGVQS